MFSGLGVWYCGVKPGARQLSLKGLRDHEGRSTLPAGAQAWVVRVIGDPDHALIGTTRNPLTQGRTARTLFLSNQAPQGHQQRTMFPTTDGTGVDTRRLVVSSRDVARRHVQSFLNDIDAGLYGPGGSWT